MKKPTRALTYLRTAMLTIALVLPVLSLVLLGSLWLWEKGYVLYWAIAACLIVAFVYTVERWLLRETVASASTEIDPADEPDPSWTGRETAAWDAVQAIANSIDPIKLNSRDAILELGTRTVDAVALEMHPGEKDPLWKFTLPEALRLVERVSGELGQFVRENIPLGDRLTVGQFMSIYRWRSTIGLAESAFDLWRIIRLMNPMSAITHEMREKVTRKIYDWGRDELARRLASAYVHEVGRAAIDLYGGRLRVSPETLATTVTEATQDDTAAAQELAEPLRILVTGQVNAGKSSLVNALTDEVQAAVDVLPATRGYTAYDLKREGSPEALLIDAPGIRSDTEDMAEMLAEADDSDLVVWVSSATRPDRDTDRKALDTLRNRFAVRLERRAPPILIVLTHIDQLRPFRQWSPPYDLLDKENPKAASIGDAVRIVAAELGAPVQSVVPVCLDENLSYYNIDVLWAKVLDVMPEVQGARLVRVLAAAGDEANWLGLWTQAVNAGRVIARTLTS